jgi:hypothetical protein
VQKEIGTGCDAELKIGMRMVLKSVAGALFAAATTTAAAAAKLEQKGNQEIRG